MGPSKQLTLTFIFVLFSISLFSTTYYVSLTGSDANDGLSEVNAWRTIAYAVGQVSAGDIVYVKAGNYGAETITFSSSGTSGNPIIIQGYQTTPGDSPTSTYQPGDALDANLMPLLQGSDTEAYAFSLVTHDYIEIRNFQITDYYGGIYNGSGSSDNITVDNLIGVSFGTWVSGGADYGVYISGTNCTIQNSIVTDAGTSAFWVVGGNNTIDNCKAYGHTEENDFTNFYIVAKSDNNTVQNCLASELNTNLNTNLIYYYYFDGNSNNVTSCTATNPAVESEASRGFGILGTSNNTFTNCTSNFIDAAFYLYGSGATNNTFTNCFVNGDNGYTLRNGPSANNFNNCRTENCIMAIRFQETTGSGVSASNNNFINCTFRNTTGNWVDFSNQPGASTNNNKFINCTIYDTQYLFDYQMPSSGNEMINCIIAGANHFIQPPQTYIPGFAYKHCNFYKSDTYTIFPSLPTNPDTTNVLFQPPVFVDPANGDFHLKASSPCINAGTATDAPSTDFEGDARPMQGGIDMGIDETPYVQSNDFYVATTGNNSNDGLTEGTAWQTITYAVTQVGAGDNIHVKAGNYGAEKIDMDVSGTSWGAITIRGYKDTPGVDPVSTYQPGDALDATVMPLLQGSDGLGRAFDLTNRDYIEIRNIQINNYQSGIHSENGSDYITLNNIIGLKFGVPPDDINAFGIYLYANNSTITNCIMTDADNYNFYLNNSNNLIDNCQSYRVVENGGYFFLIEGDQNTVQNSIAKILHPSPLGGHGFGTRNGPNNTFINCEATNINYPFYCRWPNSAYNTFRNCTVYDKNGLVLRDGAHHNTFENCKVINGDYGIGFYDTIEEDQNDPCAYDNTIQNCTFYNIGTMFNMHVETGNYASTVQNNKIINCSVYNATNLFKDAMPSSNNEITNCIFEDVDLWLDPSNTGTAYPLNFSFNYCNFYDTPAWPANPDTSNIIQLPSIFTNTATGDLHLNPSSPCIDAGTATNAPTTDYEGDSRPMGNAIDIGADETPYTQVNDFYVSVSGNDSNNGLTEATAWRTIQHGVTQVVAGDVLHVKAGNYGAEDIDFSWSGLPGSPITIRGYQTTPYDNPVSTYQPGDALDANLMPLLVDDDTEDRAFDLTNDDYIEIRNFQIDDYESAVHSETNSDYCTFYNIIGTNLGKETEFVNAFGFYITGTNNTIDNCVITDAGNYCYFIAENNNTIKNSFAYGYTESANIVDYYFHIYGDFNTIENCIAKELYTTIGYDSGHGIGARGGANNTFTNCEAHNLNYPIYARWSSAANNTFTNCTVYGANGFVLRDGAHDNTFNNCKAVDSVMGIRFFDSSEDGGQNNPCAWNNTFNNCTFQNITGNMFDLNSSSYVTSVSNNKFINCTIVSPHNLFKDLMPSSGNELINCIVTDVDNFIQLGNGAGETLNFSYKNCNFFNCPSFPAGSITENIITSDPLFVDAANNDYHIQNGSPCSNNGTSTDAPSTDFEGDTRPYSVAIDIGIDENTSTLPIELLSFEALPKKDWVLIKWTTVSEINNDYFLLQRSKDGADWEDLSYIDGHGNSYVSIDYDYEDRNPYPGTSYYRLKDFDYHGNEETSPTIAVNLGEIENSINFHPNPVKDILNIDLKEGQSIEIIDTAGKHVLHSASTQIDLSHLNDGTYFLILKDSEGYWMGFEQFVKAE